MSAQPQFQIEHVAPTPRGWKVRSKKSGSHVLRFAVPPGRRKKGAAKLLEVLHPKEEKNPSCIVSHRAKSNPEELLLFLNPSTGEKKRATRERAARIRAARLNTGKKKRRNAGTANHKAGCKCFACKYQRGENPRRKAKRATPQRRRKDRQRKNPVTRKRAANQSGTEEAVRLFEIFHGKDAREITEKHVSAAMRKDYTALGKLVAVVCDDAGMGEKEIAVHWDRCPHIDFSEDHVTLASSPDGRQLYAIGGNQNLNGCLDKFEGVDPTKDLIDLGEVAAIVYEARKIHDNFEPVLYCHKFGGHNRTRPGWFFDRLKKQVFFIGGEYEIDITAKISPGIEG